MAEVVTVGDIENSLMHHAVSSEPNIFDVDGVDDFLAHVGVKGMKWGHRKPGEIAVAGKQRVSAGLHTWNEKRAASGQRMIDRANGSTKRAALHIAGRHVAAQILLSAAALGVHTLPPNPVVKKGAYTAIHIARIAVTVRDINGAAKLTQASRRNNKKS